MGVLHETGHALYEAGLPVRWRGQPVGDQRGIAVHESQSLLMEMQACRSPAFVGYLAGELRSTFGDDPAFAPDNLQRIYTRVERGFIRVDADEITYPLHVILRHRLERQLIAGELEVADLPVAWNEGMRELVGVTRPMTAWAASRTSTGRSAASATSLLHAGRHARGPTLPRRPGPGPGLLDSIGQGDFAPLLAWLRQNVHGQGAMPRFRDLVERLRRAAGGGAVHAASAAALSGEVS